MSLADNTLDEEEIRAVSAVLGSRWLSAGPHTRRFERSFAAALGVPDAVAVSSGTAALHLAVLALGLRPGDEVIMPSLTFVASAAVVALHGGVPVFADLRHEHDLTVDPDDVRRLLTPRTTGIVAMHYGGHPADVAALRDLAARHGAWVIEDAAHAPLVHHGGRALGSHGDIGCFSFHATKNLTTGEGGMVVARNPEMLESVRRMRSHHLSASTWDRERSGTAGYDVGGIGLNYRPTEISAVIGLAQLAKLPADRVRRRELLAVYHELLGRVPGLVIPFADARHDSAHHLFAVLLPPSVDREAVRAQLNRAGVQTSVHYPPTHRFPLYRDRYPSARRALPVTDAVADRLLSLPLHSRMSPEDVSFVARALTTALRPAGGGPKAG